MRHRNYDRHPRCPVEMCAEIIGEWKGRILYHLLKGPRRSNELRRLLPEVTQRMLTMQLRDLEEHGIISRKIYPEVPPKVEYSLSELGESLRPLILMMKDWGTGYLKGQATLVRLQKGHDEKSVAKSTQ